jgi:hypothetical protein
MLYFARIPRYEDTSFVINPIDRPAHDIKLDLNIFKENLPMGDHEFKFGFEYKTSALRTTSSYGNGMFIVDDMQTELQGPLTQGTLFVQHQIQRDETVHRSSFYVNDTVRKDQLTLNIGFRFDHQSGEIQSSRVPAVNGFESILGPINISGFDPGISLNNVAPRIGAAYDLTGDGKTVLRGSFAVYYDHFDSRYLDFFNPAGWPNGAAYSYSNHNGDRVLSSDELSNLSFFGGWNGSSFELAKRHLAGAFHNSRTIEFSAALERQLLRDFYVEVAYTYRRYVDPASFVPLGIGPEDFTLGGIFKRDTPIGEFSFPYFVLSREHDGVGTLNNLDDYSQRYHGMEIHLRKRMSHNFMINSILLFQWQRASYDGGDSISYIFPDGGLFGSWQSFNPTGIPFVDNKLYGYSSEGAGKSGQFPYSEWTLKVGGTYLFPKDISAGCFVRFQQGYPYVLMTALPGTTFDKLYGITGPVLSLVEPLGSRRYENVFTLDLKLDKAWDLGSYGRLNTTIDLFNVTNSNAVLRRNRDILSMTFNSIQEVNLPRLIRFGIRYSF